MQKWVLAAVFAVSVVGANAQTGAPVTGGAPLEPAKVFDNLLSGFEQDVVPAAKAMPAEKFDFTPDNLHIPGATYSGVLTFAGEVKHLTQTNYAFAAGITGGKPAADLKQIDGLKSKDEIIRAFEDSFRTAHQAIATLTVANENDPAGHGMSKAGLAAYIPVHGFDHYGQIVEYLRMNGIIPPASVKK